MDAIDLLGKVLQNKTLSSAIGKQVLGGLMGGGQQQSAPAPGGGLLGQILSGAIGGGQQAQRPQGNPMMDAVLDKVLQKVTGRQSAPSNQGGGMGDLLGSVLGGGQPSRQAPQPQRSGGGGIGDLLGSVLGGGQSQGGHSHGHSHGHGQSGYGQGGHAHAAPPSRPSMQQMNENDCAALMIRAMVNAAKSDGKLDQNEQQSILQKFGQLGEAELEFLRREFAAPLDVRGFAGSIPNGLEQQVYAISVTAVEVDQQNEANYLGQLAQGLNLDPRWCNQVHDQLGAPRIFG